MKKKRVHWRFVAFFACASLFAATALTDQMVRIAVATKKERLSLSGPSLSITTADGQELAHGDRISFSSAASGILVNGRPAHAQTVHVNGANLIETEGKRYRNTLEVVWQNEKGARFLTLVHPMSLESYVAGVVSSEVPTSWPKSMLAAQAISARTYAVAQKYRRLNSPYHLVATVMDQVYHGADSEHKNAVAAAQATYGQILTFSGQPAQTYFHSSCGGHTESAEEGWGKAVPYLPGGSCGFCTRAKGYNWQYEVGKSELKKAVGLASSDSIQSVRITKKSRSGRAKQLEVAGKRAKKSIAGEALRAALGYTNLRSTLIDEISLSTRAVTFRGRGFGHGVGLCQWGGFGMAEEGYTAEEILDRYYKGTEIRRLY